MIIEAVDIAESIEALIEAKMHQGDSAGPTSERVRRARQRLAYELSVWKDGGHQ